MAVITFDEEKNSVTVLVEKMDSLRFHRDDVTEVCNAGQYTSGFMFCNGEVKLCAIRGERG